MEQEVTIKDKYTKDNFGLTNSLNSNY